MNQTHLDWSFFIFGFTFLFFCVIMTLRDESGRFIRMNTPTTFVFRLSCCKKKKIKIYLELGVNAPNFCLKGGFIVHLKTYDNKVEAILSNIMTVPVPFIISYRKHVEFLSGLLRNDSICGGIGIMNPGSWCQHVIKEDIPMLEGIEIAIETVENGVEIVIYADSPYRLDEYIVLLKLYGAKI